MNMSIKQKLIVAIQHFSVTKNNKNYFKHKPLTTDRFIASVIPYRCET